MNQDPIGLAGGINKNIYIKNPNKGIEPLGLMEELSHIWNIGHGMLLVQDLIIKMPCLQLRENFQEMSCTMERAMHSVIVIGLAL